jgi:hypothetical protein
MDLQSGICNRGICSHATQPFFSEPSLYGIELDSFTKDSSWSNYTVTAVFVTLRKKR